ncbi:MAG TPA: molybdopterin-dependent oxidoreductase [Thermoanaerobacterales bacterium]|nr:molybdopterin-dependent oxidoreductase [Thermoanaerobacterales bacterium]
MYKKYLVITIFLMFMLPLMAGCSQKSPQVPAEAKWKIQVTGKDVDKTLTDVDMEKLGPVDARIAMLKKDDSTEGHDWTGVPLSKVLESAGIKEFEKVVLESSDGYKVELPKDVALAQNTLVAYRMDGNDLPEGDGPVRMVVDGQPSKMWTKALVKISAE